MAETIILKNRNLLIKEFSEEHEKDGQKKWITTKVSIERSAGVIENFTKDESGFAQKEGEEKLLEPKISLKDLASQEKVRFYKQLLQSKYNEIEHLVILSGAGSSVGIGKMVKGYTMAGLWDAMSEGAEKEHLETLIKETKFAPIDKEGKIITDKLSKDLESLLSKAGMKQIVDGNKKLEESIKAAREFIVTKCSLDLPDDAPHAHFLNKVILRPQKFPRVKIFTLNYDTLFEQAAAKEKFTVLDGFTFSSPRAFNGRYFDYDIIETKHNRQDKKDSTISKLFYLFKMHGSLNWGKKGNEIEQIDGKIEVNDRVMIFPQDSKYEHSYEQPYFEMMARFQQAMRTENTLLITIGFSFLDKHISSVILESLKQNSSLNLISLTYPSVVGNEKEYQLELHKIAELQSRITLIGETFNSFTNEFPENMAHKRFDLLEELNEQLKTIKSGNGVDAK